MDLQNFNLLMIQLHFINSEIKLSLRTTLTQSCLHINHVLHVVPIPYYVDIIVIVYVLRLCLPKK
jgi:hypothetical protein